MWYVFPQVAGLGQRQARRYAIARRARRAPTWTIRSWERGSASAPTSARAAGRTAEAIFGGIDAVKLRSSMTLFKAADPDDRRFVRALDAFYGGVPDKRTLELLAA